MGISLGEDKNKNELKGHQLFIIIKTKNNTETESKQYTIQMIIVNLYILHWWWNIFQSQVFIKCPRDDNIRIRYWLSGGIINWAEHNDKLEWHQRQQITSCYSIHWIAYSQIGLRIITQHLTMYWGEWIGWETVRTKSVTDSPLWILSLDD